MGEAAGKGLQLLQDAHAQPAAVHPKAFRPQGGGHVLQPLGGKIRPALVILGSFSPASTGPDKASASCLMLRNLYTANSFPYRPVRICL